MLLILNYSPLRYAKSGALEFYDWELEHYPKETATRFARTGVGPRHEGSMDTACDLLPIYPRVFGFTQGGLAALPFHADTHVRAIMMHMVWDEMRARENLKDKDKRTLGPLGVAELNDQLWAVGTLLRSENDEVVLSILDPAFKPFAPDPRMADWSTGRA